jgi:hypothetical protein
LLAVCTSQLVSILIAHRQPVNNNPALLARPTSSAPSSDRTWIRTRKMIMPGLTIFSHTLEQPCSNRTAR